MAVKKKRKRLPYIRVPSSAHCEIGGLNCGMRGNTERKRICYICHKVACWACGSIRGSCRWGSWMGRPQTFYCNTCQVQSDRSYGEPTDAIVILREVNLFLVGKGYGVVKMSNPCWGTLAIKYANENLPKSRAKILTRYLKKRMVVNRLLNRMNYHERKAM